MRISGPLATGTRGGSSRSLAPKLIFSLLVASTVAACGPRPSQPPTTPPTAAAATAPRIPVERDYLPPIGLPSRPGLAVAADSPEAALRLLADRLKGRDFQKVEGASGPGRLVLEFSGDPEPYLDCGTFIVGGATPTEPTRREPASRLQIRIPVPATVAAGEVILRQLRLDARIVITAEREQGLTQLTALVIYGATRTVDRVALDGRILDTSRETMAFRTDQLGRFAMGLECLATGRLEADVLAPISG